MANNVRDIVRVPAGPGLPGSEMDLVSYLRQFTPWNFKYPLTDDDFRGFIATLRGEIVSGTTTRTVTHRVPSNYNFLVRSINGHLNFNDLDGETLSISGLGNPTFLDRMFIKAMNTRFDLRIADKDFKIFDGKSEGSTGNGIITLASLLPHLGGKPLEFDKIPMVIQGGDSLELSIYSNETAAAIIGGSTNVGIELRGHLVKVRES